MNIPEELLYTLHNSTISIEDDIKTQGEIYRRSKLMMDELLNNYQN